MQMVKITRLLDGGQAIHALFPKHYSLKGFIKERGNCAIANGRLESGHVLATLKY